MNSKIFSCVALAAVVAGLTSCSDDTWNPNVTIGDGEGMLNDKSVTATVVNAEQIINDSKNPNRVRSRAVTDLSRYLINVTDVNGKSVADWTYSTIPSMPTFVVGTYTMTVKSHEVKPVAWDEPYFCGEQTFTIRKGEVTDVEPVKCVLSNIRVSILFSDDLKAVASDDLKVTVTSTENVSLEYGIDETRSGYFAAENGLETLSVHFYGTISGYTEDFTTVLTDVAPGQHRKVTFVLKHNSTTPPDEFGTIELPGEGISVGTEIVEQDLTSESAFEEETMSDSDRPGKEEGGTTDPDPEQPTPPADQEVATFSSATLDIENVNLVSDFADGMEPKQDAIVTITVPNGVADLWVTIKNEKLEEVLPGVGLDSRFNLADPGDLRDVLEGNFGFPVAENVKGHTEVTFNITNFVPMLNIYPGEDYEFEIKVTDQEQKKDAPEVPSSVLSLKFKS